MVSFWLVLAQRSPVLRVLLDARIPALPRFANVLKFTAPAATTLGASMHAVTGATDPEIQPFGEASKNPATAKIGEEFVWAWGATLPGKKARSYLIEGLPPGIEWDGNVASSSATFMQGTPTQAGSFTVNITAFHFQNLQGTASPVYELIVNVEGESDGAAPPVITTKLKDQTVSTGDTVTLTVVAEGPDVSYAWDKDGTAIPDSNQAELVLENVSTEDSGLYTVKASNAGGDVTSSARVAIATGIPIPDGHTLYSVSPREAQLRALGPDGVPTSTVPITFDPPQAGQTITGAHGLAWDPVTKQLFAILSVKPDGPDAATRMLGTIVPETGIATLIGNLTQDKNYKFSGLAVNDQGTLYGVTGNDANAADPETVFTIDPQTAQPTLFTPVTNGAGNQGEAIAFNPDDGKLYHIAGGAPPEVQILEAIDLTDKSKTPVAVTDTWSEGKTIAYLGNGQFLIANDKEILTVSLDGTLTTAATIDHITKGFALVPSSSGASADFNISLQRSAEGTQLSFPASPGEIYIIQNSSNLSEWIQLTTGTVADDASEVTFTDPEAPQTPRFYRASRE